MNRKRVKKLALSKETLRTLDDRLMKAAGGATEFGSGCLPSDCRTCWDTCTDTRPPCRP